MQQCDNYLTCCCSCCHFLLHTRRAAVLWREHELELVVHRKLEGDIRYQPGHVGAIAAVQGLCKVTSAAWLGGVMVQLSASNVV